jgi:hypothetical protein
MKHQTNRGKNTIIALSTCIDDLVKVIADQDHVKCMMIEEELRQIATQGKAPRRVGLLQKMKKQKFIIEQMAVSFQRELTEKHQPNFKGQGRQGGQNSGRHLDELPGSKNAGKPRKSMTEKDIRDYKSTLGFVELEAHENMVHHIVRYVNGPFKDFKVEACMVFLMTNCTTVYSKQKEKVKEILLQNVDGSSELKDARRESQVGADKKRKGSIQRDMSFGTQPAQQITQQDEDIPKKRDAKKLISHINSKVPGTPFAAFKSKNTSFSNVSGGVLAQMSNHGLEQETPRQASRQSASPRGAVPTRKSTHLLSPKSIRQSSADVKSAQRAQIAVTPMSRKTSSKRNKDDDTSSYDPLQPKRPEYTESSFHTSPSFYTDSSDAKWFEEYKKNKESNRQKDEAYRKEHLCMQVDFKKNDQLKPYLADAHTPKQVGPSSNLKSSLPEKLANTNAQ